MLELGVIKGLSFEVLECPFALEFVLNSDPKTGYRSEPPDKE